MEVLFNHFDAIADALVNESKKAEQKIAENAVEHIKEHIIANGQVRTGAMLDSVEATQSEDGTMQVTVGADYAAYQNYGTRYLPPRPFFEPGLDDTQPDIDAVMQGIVDALSGAV